MAIIDDYKSIHKILMVELQRGGTPEDSAFCPKCGSSVWCGYGCEHRCLAATPGDPSGQGRRE